MPVHLERGAELRLDAQVEHQWELVLFIDIKYGQPIELESEDDLFLFS